MTLNQCEIGDNVMVKINGHTAMVRVIQKGRKCLNDVYKRGVFAPRYRASNNDIKLNRLVQKKDLFHQIQKL